MLSPFPGWPRPLTKSNTTTLTIPTITTSTIPTTTLTTPTTNILTTSTTTTLTIPSTNTTSIPTTTTFTIPTTSNPTGNSYNNRLSSHQYPSRPFVKNIPSSIQLVVTPTTIIPTTSNSIITDQPANKKRDRNTFNDNIPIITKPTKKATPTTNKNKRTRESEAQYNTITNIKTSSTATTTIPTSSNTLTIVQPANPFENGPRDWGTATQQIALNNASKIYKRKPNSIVGEFNRKNNTYRKKQLAKRNSAFPICPNKPVAGPNNQLDIIRTIENINEILGEDYEPSRKFYEKEHQEYKKRKLEQEKSNNEGDIYDNNDLDNVNDNNNDDVLMLCNDNVSQKSDDLGFNGGEDFIG